MPINPAREFTIFYFECSYPNAIRRGKRGAGSNPAFTMEFDLDMLHRIRLARIRVHVESLPEYEQRLVKRCIKEFQKTTGTDPYGNRILEPIRFLEPDEVWLYEELAWNPEWFMAELDCKRDKDGIPDYVPLFHGTLINIAKAVKAKRLETNMTCEQQAQAQDQTEFLACALDSLANKYTTWKLRPMNHVMFRKKRELSKAKTKLFREWLKTNPNGTAAQYEVYWNQIKTQAQRA